MQAVILAGGKGTRLRPYTMVLPKPLVPIGEIPILEIIIKQLVYFGFDRITISTGHLAGLLEAYCGDGKRWGVQIDYVREDLPLNTAGALKLVEKCEDNFLVLNGDILTTLNFAELFATHIREDCAATIATKERRSQIDFGMVETDENNYLTGYIEKPVHTVSVSMGIYVLSKKCQDLIGINESIGMPDLLLRIKESGGQVYCFKSDDRWLDIGRIDDFERAQEDFETYKGLFLPE